MIAVTGIVGEDETLLAIVLAFSLSILCFAGIWVLDKLHDSSPHDEGVAEVVRLLVEQVGLIIGVGWETCFNKAVMSIAACEAAPVLTQTLLGPICVAVVAPAWRIYLVPMEVLDGWRFGFLPQHVSRLALGVKSCEVSRQHFVEVLNQLMSVHQEAEEERLKHVHYKFLRRHKTHSQPCLDDYEAMDSNLTAQAKSILQSSASYLSDTDDPAFPPPKVSPLRLAFRSTKDLIVAHWEHMRALRRGERTAGAEEHSDSEAEGCTSFGCTASTCGTVDPRYLLQHDSLYHPREQGTSAHHRPRESGISADRANRGHLADPDHMGKAGMGVADLGSPEDSPLGTQRRIGGYLPHVTKDTDHEEDLPVPSKSCTCGATSRTPGQGGEPVAAPSQDILVGVDADTLADLRAAHVVRPGENGLKRSWSEGHPRGLRARCVSWHDQHEQAVERGPGAGGVTDQKHEVGDTDRTTGDGYQVPANTEHEKLMFDDHGTALLPSLVVPDPPSNGPTSPSGASLSGLERGAPHQETDLSGLESGALRQALEARSHWEPMAIHRTPAFRFFNAGARPQGLPENGGREASGSPGPREGRGADWEAEVPPRCGQGEVEKVAVPALHGADLGGSGCVSSWGPLLESGTTAATWSASSSPRKAMVSGYLVGRKLVVRG
mmetsp:Transcript_54327/g.124640  ORF Transcript_54327/g.124640 Transcript_54327/m.124640 type:complete len:663 (+) Transcript_54327:2-1990(+)